MIPNEAKEREIRKYRKLESQHLRLRRTKIRLADFRTVKVIGKGAFGEVRGGHLLPSVCHDIASYRFGSSRKWILARCMR